MGVDGKSVTPVMGKELGGDVGERVGWRWLDVVSVVWGGLVVFQSVVRIPYDGFLWGNGVLGPLTGFRPGETILGGSRGGGQFGTGYKPSIRWGYRGGRWWWWSLQWC